MLADPDITKVPCPACEHLPRGAYDLDCRLCWASGLVTPDERVEYLRQRREASCVTR